MADAILAQGGIYQIKNTANGKMYVGSAVRLKKRWYEHERLLRQGAHHSQKLQRAWAKYGESAFIFEVLELVADKELLLAREQHWIDHFGSSGSLGLNICRTAGSRLGVLASPESKEKMRLARIGKKPSPATVAKQVAALTGRVCSMSARSKIGAKARVRAELPPSIAMQELIAKRNVATSKKVEVFKSVVSQDLTLAEMCRLAGISATTYSRWVAAGKIVAVPSDYASRALKISIARKGYKMPESTKAILSSINKGKAISEATRRKISLAHAAATAVPGYVDPRIGRVMPREGVERARAKKIGQKRTAEQKSNMSVAAKARAVKVALEKAGRIGT